MNKHSTNFKLFQEKDHLNIIPTKMYLKYVLLLTLATLLARLGINSLKYKIKLKRYLSKHLLSFLPRYFFSLTS